VNDNVFITIDVDFFDPSVMPSTGTPEPDGFDFRHILNVLENVFRSRNVVGCDIVELAPLKDLHYPDFTIAKLVQKIMSLNIINSQK